MPLLLANKHTFTSRRPWLGMALSLACGLEASTGRANSEFSDDAAIKADFETRLGELYEAGSLPGGAETLRQLHQEKTGPVVLPVSSTANPNQAAASNSSAIYDRTRQATLLLGHLYLCGKCDQYHGNLAGAVIISPDGLALTNYHVLDTRESLAFGAMAADGRIFAIAEVLASSKKDDIALIRLRDAIDLPHVPIKETVVTGDEVFVISHPDGFYYSFTRGYLSRKYLTPKGKVPRLQITADFAKGSSGSGIFTMKGELIGLATATNSIYYGKEGNPQGHLQMVIKSGVPISSIGKWFEKHREN